MNCWTALACIELRAWISFSPTSSASLSFGAEPPFTIECIDARFSIIPLSWNMIDALACAVADVAFDAAVLMTVACSLDRQSLDRCTPIDGETDHGNDD